MKNIADNMRVYPDKNNVSIGALGVSETAKRDTREYDKGAFLILLERDSTPSAKLEILADTAAEDAEEVIFTQENITVTGLYIVEYKAENMPDGKPKIALRLTEASGGALDRWNISVIHLTYDFHRSFEELTDTALAIYKLWES